MNETNDAMIKNSIQRCKLFDNYHDCNHFNEDDITLNLKQIESLIYLIKLKHTDSDKYEKLNKLFKSLNDLIDFYNSQGETRIEQQLIKYLIIKRLNYFNDLFNLNKRQIISFNNDKKQSMPTSYTSDSINQNISLNLPLNCLNEYEKFDAFESNLMKTNEFLNAAFYKLIIKTIKLNDYLNIDHHKDDQNKYECIVLQYDKLKKQIRKSLRQLKNKREKEVKIENDDSEKKQTKLRNKSQPRKINNLLSKSVSKRSCSADQNVNIIKKKELKQKAKSKIADLAKLDGDFEFHVDNHSSSELSNLSDDDQIDCDTSNQTDFKIDQKFIQIDKFRIDSAVTTENLNKPIQLNKSCNEIIIILYKLIRIDLQKEESYAKLPIKYEKYIIKDDKLHLKTSKILNKSFLNYDINPLKNQLQNVCQLAPQQQQQTPSTNVFKRIFKKSKSSTRINMPLEITSENSSIQNDSSFELELNKNHLEFYLNPTNPIVVDQFIHWLNIWLPKLDQKGIEFNDMNKENNLEIASIFLQSLNMNQKFQHSISNHRSKLAQHLTTQSTSSRSSNSSGVSSNNSDTFSDDYYYYLRLTTSSSSQILHSNNINNEFLTNICSISEIENNLNDLCQLCFNFDNSLNKSIKMNIDLYKINIIDSSLKRLKSELISSNSLNLNHNLNTITLNLTENIDLKLSFSFMSKYYPTKKTSIDLYEFDLNEMTNDSFNKEMELSNLCDKFLLNYNFDLVMLRKIIQCFMCLNMNNLIIMNNRKTNQDIDRRNNRKILLNKLYDSFLKLLNDYNIQNQIEKNHYINLDSILSNLDQPKSFIQFIIQIIKNLIENESNQINSNKKLAQTYEVTLRNFHLIIQILVTLSKSKSSNMTLYELKYDLNDIFSKLSKQLIVSKNNKIQIYKFLNLKFLDHLSDNNFYTGNELANLILNKLFVTNNNNMPAEDQTMNELNIKFINDQIFSLNLFINNYQFRDGIIEYIIHNHYLNKNNLLLSFDQILMLKDLIRFKLKMSRQNLDNLIKSSIKLLINSLIHYFKVKEKCQENNMTTNLNINYLLNGYLCLIELLDLIQSNNNNKSYNYIEQLTNQELKHIFQIIISFNYGSTNSNIFKATVLNKTNLFYEFSSFNLNNMDKVWLNVNLFIVKFSNYIQKYLLCYSINNNNNSNSNSEIDNSHDNLIKTYFEMMLLYIDQPCVSLNLTTTMKIEMLNCALNFWRNFKLKRSLNLNEFILTRLCQSLIKNMYFKVISLQTVIGSTNMTILHPFVDFINDISDNSVYKFYSTIIKFMNEIFTYNSYDIEAFKEFLYSNIMNILIKNDRKRRKNLVSGQIEDDLDYVNNQSFNECENFDLSCLCKIQYKLVLEMIKLIVETENVTYFSNRHNSNLILKTFIKCFDYLMLKDECDLEMSVTQIEKLVIIYDLIKETDRMCNNRLFSNQKYFNDLKRKIKMYLLDDLYHVNKQEKNYLQMSFIRKEQADLLDWNVNKKSESDLKEMLYLKSLKKIALNSLNNENYLIQDTGVLSSYFKNTENLIKSRQKLTNDLNGNQLMVQFEICKELCEYYERLDSNNGKFNCILNTESKFIELASNTFMKLNMINQPAHTNNLLHSIKANNHGNIYFRIGLFGSLFKFESTRNRYFLYKHSSYEMLSNIQNLIMNRLSVIYNSNNVELLHHNQEPDQFTKNNPDKCYIQVCALNRLEKSKLIELIDEMDNERDLVEWKNRLNKSYEKSKSFYYFDRPFYMRSSLSHSSETSSNRSSSLNDEFSCSSLDEETNCSNESVENLWLERSVLILDENSYKFEHLVQFDEIKYTFKLLLNPIRNAISDINEKTKELKTFVGQFSTNSSFNTINTKDSNANENLNVIHSLQPLTMRLLGCLDARVNGGLIKYVRELLNESIIETKNFKKKKNLLNQLHLSIREQLKILENGLMIHDRILKNIELGYKTEHDSNGGKYSKNIEHIKHMNELNNHLINCFKLLTNELDEKWSKIT
jgi:hypothetical protein